METCDILIIGGGIVGLATAFHCEKQYPNLRIIVLEKEQVLAFHQTGRNSGVIHSGIYYKPGSLKATNCRKGKAALEEFCREEDIPFDTCGKVIVATHESELERLENLYKRGQENGVICEKIGIKRLKELEPHCAGIAAIHVPETGIVDYKKVCARLAEQLSASGKNSIRLGEEVLEIRITATDATVRTSKSTYSAKFLVNCAGIYSDRIATLTGTKPNVKIIPFRGEYFALKPEAWHLCKSLIYPVPNPEFPFLGVHFTRMIEGGAECGPNAVLAFAREGYAKTDVHIGDLVESLSYSGFQILARKYWREGWNEMKRSFSKRLFVAALQRLVPEIRSEHLVTRAAGIRAQAVSADGALVDDFFIQTNQHVVNVLNAPSPAATAGLTIGASITKSLADVMQ